MSSCTKLEIKPITTEYQSAVRPRVLLAEREKEIRDILVPWLLRAGFDCREAEDGQEAIGLLATGLRIDLVLSCLLMAPVDGYTLLLHVKKNHPRVPFAFVTGIMLPEVREFVLQNGADGYLIKPFTCEEFLTLVSGVLARPPKPAPLRPGTHLPPASPG